MNSKYDERIISTANCQGNIQNKDEDVKESFYGDKPVILITPDSIPSSLPYDVETRLVPVDL